MFLSCRTLSRLALNLALCPLIRDQNEASGISRDKTVLLVSFERSFAIGLSCEFLTDIFLFTLRLV